MILNDSSSRKTGLSVTTSLVFSRPIILFLVALEGNFHSLSNHSSVAQQIQEHFSAAFTYSNQGSCNKLKNIHIYNKVLLRANTAAFKSSLFLKCVRKGGHDSSSKNTTIKSQSWSIQANPSNDSSSAQAFRPRCHNHGIMTEHYLSPFWK